MQTFLPYPSFQASVATLDRQRLGKQRVEVMQILKAMDMRFDAGWGSHVATRMWRGYAPALVQYGLEVCTEWCRRGYTDTCYEKIEAFGEDGHFLTVSSGMPPWLGRDDVHTSHQSNLVRKDPDHYRQYFPNVPDDLEYVWPV